MQQLTFQYRNQYDNAGPLLADVAWVADGKAKPIIAVMHGYSGTRKAVTADIEALAKQGVVAIAPDMRGRGESCGVWDSGGYDVDDIYWAVRHAMEHEPALRGEVNPDSRHVVGYSGGGANAISCACRFPDFFHTATSFFGLVDYADFYRVGERPDCNEWMAAAIGKPDDQPERFAARTMLGAAGNAARVKMKLLWDVEEKMCPLPQIEKWIAEFKAAGGKQIDVSVTRPGDAKRWIHNYRTGNPDLNAADAFFMKDVLAPVDPRQLALPQRGELVVPGYLRTSHFEVHVDKTECSGVGRVRYDLTGGQPLVEWISRPSGDDGRIIYTARA